MTFISLKSYFFILLNIALALAAFEPKNSGVTMLGSGNTGRALSGASFELFRNPALLQPTAPSVALFYKNYYEIESLNQFTLQAGIHLGSLPLAAAVQRYGNAKYAEDELRLGSALEIVPGLRVGATFKFMHIGIDGYGGSQTWAADAGLQYQVLERVQAGWTIENLNRPQIGRAKKQLPQTMALGLAYQPATQLYLLLDVVKTDGSDFEARVGLQYQMAPARFLAGFRSGVDTWHGGVLFNWNHMQLGYGLEYHMQLGASHALEAGFAF